MNKPVFHWPDAIRNLLGSLLVLLCGCAALAQGQVVERIVDNNTLSVAVAGDWAKTSTGTGFLGTDFLHDRNAGKGTKRVIYPLYLHEAGEYEVFARWSAGSDRAPSVPIDIVHSGGTTTKFVNQQVQGGEWVSLGRYLLGQRGSRVTIRNARTSGLVIADAIRFLKTTQGGNTQPYVGAPLCPTHDDRQAHGLWDARRGCHYDHTHNNDPDHPQAVALFGPASAYLGGKTISYPWQTHNHAGVEENVAKHNGYKWMVDLDLPPLYLRLNWLGAPTPNAVKSVRTQYHFLSTNADARVRLHSFWAEMQLCPANDMNNCGIVRGGGLWDTGILHAPYKQQWVPVPGQDPPDLEGKIFRPGVDDPNRSWPTIDPYRAHSHTCQDLGVYSNSVSQTVDNAVLWTSSPGFFGYNRHMGMFIKVLDAAECVDPTDINQDVPLCPDGRCRFNGSEHVGFTYWAWVDPALDGSALDSDGIHNGRVSFRGFTDVTGKIDLTCSEANEHCVPYALENAPVGWASWETPSNSGYWPERYKDNDVSPPGEWWIKLPN
jgi:hypothetical protein